MNLAKKNNQSLQKGTVRLIVFVLSFVIMYAALGRFYNLVSVPIGWEQAVALTPENLTISSYHVAQQGSLAVVSCYGTYKNKSGIYALISYDRGQSFFSPILIASIENTLIFKEDEATAQVLAEIDDERVEGAARSESVSDPRVAVSFDGAITIAWQQLSNSVYKIYYSKSTNKGISWSEPREIELGAEMEILPQIFYDKDKRLHLIYHSLTGSRFDLYHVVEGEDGFEEPVKISSQDEIVRGAFFPGVLYTDENIYVAWVGKRNTQLLTDDIFFTSSDDNGKSWRESIQVTSSEANDTSPSLLAQDETIYLVYQNDENTNWEINLIRGYNLGEVFEEKPTKVYETNVSCLMPYIKKAPNGEFMIFWSQSYENTQAIMSSRYEIESATFTNAIALSDSDHEASRAHTFDQENQMLTLWHSKGRLYSKSTDVYAPPPSLYSKTHPRGKWSEFGTAEIIWSEPSDISGIAGYATILNQEPLFDPTVQNIDASSTSTQVPFLPDGISYFHIRTVDRAGNYSRTIHFPLLVSKSPLGVPSIVSSTHKEGTASEENTVSFEWTQDDEERVKTYFYSFTKDSASVPSKQIDEKGLSFDDLDQGRYFLTVRAVDKADKPGRIATFELLIGDVEKLKGEDYEKMAQNIEKENEKNEYVANDQLPLERDLILEDKESIVWPDQTLLIMFDNETKQDEGDVSFRLEYKDDTSGELEIRSFIYELYRDGIKVYSGTSYTKDIRLKNIEVGKYLIRVYGTYSYKSDEKSIVRNSNTVEENFSIDKLFAAPVDAFYEKLSEGFHLHWQLNSIFLFSLASALIFSMAFFKIYFFIRTAVMRIIMRIILIF